MSDLETALRAYFEMVHTCSSLSWRGWCQPSGRASFPEQICSAADRVDAALGSPCPALRTVCTRNLYVHMRHAGEQQRLFLADLAAGAFAAPGAASVYTLANIGMVWRAIHIGGSQRPDFSRVFSDEIGSEMFTELAPELTAELSALPKYADPYSITGDVCADNIPGLAIAACLYNDYESARRLLADGAAPVTYKLATAVKVVSTMDAMMASDEIKDIAAGLLQLVGLGQLQLPPVIV
jgi:hypothetical protein